MTYEIGTPHGFIPLDRGRLSRKHFSRTVSGAVALAFSALAGTLLLYARIALAPSVDEAPAAPPAVTVDRAPAAPAAPTGHARRKIASNEYIALLDPTFSLGYTPVPLSQSSPLGSNFESMTPAPPAAIAEPQNVLPVLAPLAVPSMPELVQTVPLPPLRPPELEWPASHGPARASDRVLARGNRTTIAPATPSDKRTFFEKLFGARQPSGAVLAYAAPEDGILSNARRVASDLSFSRDRWTAVYDIAAHTVYMPDGTRLEAHSGLGNRLDDPRHVNERMRGATPPHLYELQPREQLFHGVRALRLIPVGNGSIFGRTGLLAHTYMLGANGQSNGCVSFRNYNRFLQAYLNGQVKRLAVVARLN